jgi:asparagine synthase (glutamine-hydrolysing)
MSAMAGIFKFHPRDRVSTEELINLANGIDRVGPDGGRDHFGANVGMSYRAFHTTPESHFESQPLLRDGCILTWDGRLDNREEIRAMVSHKYEDEPTDLDLVFAAYKEWGTGGFAQLIGDWALALWDEAKQQLILARDYIGVRRLFYRLDQDGVAWCSILEPLVLTSANKLHLDLDYLAGCLYPHPPVDTTPYQEIRSIVPGSFHVFERGGASTTTRYWSLNPCDRLRYSCDADYERHFREVFLNSVRRRLRSDRTVLAELSGGIDSSSIVCMANELAAQRPGVMLETLSYYDTDESGGDERPYFALVEEKLGRRGHHISIASFNEETADDNLSSLPLDCFSASPGYFARSLRWAQGLDDIRNRLGTRVTLSGLGGDEFVGGIQYEAPELAEYLVNGNLVSLGRSLLRWSVARKKTVYQLAVDTLRLLSGSRNPDALFSYAIPQLPWAFLKPIVIHRPRTTFADWHQLSPVGLCMEATRYGLASQLTCADPPLVGCAEPRYPYLDQSLFVFLASIPRTQVLQSGHRRHLMRRALTGIVPDKVLFRKTKWFGSRSPFADLKEHTETMATLFNERWLSDRVVVAFDLIRSEFESTQHGGSVAVLSLLNAIGIEQWLRTLWERQLIQLPNISSGRSIPSQRLAACT